MQEYDIISIQDSGISELHHLMKLNYPEFSLCFNQEHALITWRRI
jgi:hypothetical protein